MSRKVWIPAVSGPLAPFAAEYASWLTSRAYSPSAAADRLYQFDQLSRWLAREGLAVGELTGEQAERFTQTRRAAGLVSWSSPCSVALPLGVSGSWEQRRNRHRCVRRGRWRNYSPITVGTCRSSVGCAITRCWMSMVLRHACSCPKGTA